MEALHQGISTALVLVGLAALLFGVAALWRSIAQAKAHQQDVQLEQASQELASRRLREAAVQRESHADLLFAVVPVATAMLGHWLGSRNHPPELAPSSPSCMGCIPRPPPPMPPLDDDDDTHVELDLESILAGIVELGFDRWLATLMRDARASHAAPRPDDPEPTSAVAHVVNG